MIPGDLYVAIEEHCPVGTLSSRLGLNEKQVERFCALGCSPCCAKEMMERYSRRIPSDKLVLVVETPAYRSHETASETASDNLEVI